MLRTESVALAIVLLAGRASAQETVRVSVDSQGAEGDGGSSAPATSSDGQVLAFFSTADNLVASDANGTLDVFVHDRSTGITEIVSVDSAGVQGNFWSRTPSISADGRFVAFESAASNLVSGDTNGLEDVFVHDRVTGVTERISVDSNGAEGNDASTEAAISADGLIVAFRSDATNLVPSDTNYSPDVFVHDRTTGVTERVSVDSSGKQANQGGFSPSISADGEIVAFESGASNLVPGDKNFAEDIFVHDRVTGVTERVSVSSSGAEGRDNSIMASISANGQVVAFNSLAKNLVAADTNNTSDIFVHDRTSAITERVSVDSSGAQGTGAGCSESSLSSDGRFVAFGSRFKNLVPNDTNQEEDVFLHDRVSGTTERVSVDSSGAEANDWSTDPSISSDAQVVAFDSVADNLVSGDSNRFGDVFVRGTCATTASWSNYDAGFPGTNGVPSFTSQQNPVFGTTITLDLANSSAAPTVGLLFVGFQRTSIHSGWGGDLVVVPALVIPISFSYGQDSFSGNIPDDRSLCGFVIDLQAIEADPGAAKGVSFTQGLELILGR